MLVYIMTYQDDCTVCRKARIGCIETQAGDHWIPKGCAPCLARGGSVAAMPGDVFIRRGTTAVVVSEEQLDGFEAWMMSYAHTLCL